MTLRVSAKEFKGVFPILPTCSTKDAQSLYSTNTVDIEAMKDLTERLIEAGVHGIIALGSMGEVHTVLWEEYKAVIDALVDTVNGKVPLIIGCWAPNTREAVKKAKYVMDAGGDGIMAAPPHYLKPSIENAIQFFRDLADACPDLAIMIYHNPMVFRYRIPIEKWEDLMEIPNVVAVKETDNNLPRMMVEAYLCKDKISFMCHSILLFPCMLFGFTGAWDPLWVNCGPEPILKLYKACEENNWDLARKITEDFIKLSIYEVKVLQGYDWLESYQVDWEHLVLNAAGYVYTGEPRRPFVHVPEQIIKAAEALGKEYRKIVEKWKE